MFSIVSAGGTLLLNCHFGKMTTDSYLAFNDHIYNSDWLTMPIEMKKNYVLIMKIAQKPLYFHGSNMVYLNLETFTSVRGLLLIV